MPEFRFPGPSAFKVALKLAGGSHDNYVDVATVCRKLEQDGYALSYRHTITILMCAGERDGGPIFEINYSGERVLVRSVREHTLQDETDETMRAVHAPNAATLWRTEVHRWAGEAQCGACTRAASIGKKREPPPAPPPLFVGKRALKAKARARIQPAPPPVVPFHAI